jgi:hypothetical protein
LGIRNFTIEGWFEITPSSRPVIAVKNMSRLIVLNGLIGAMGGIFECVNEGRWMMTWEGRAHFDPSLMRLRG